MLVVPQAPDTTPLTATAAGLALTAPVSSDSQTTLVELPEPMRVVRAAAAKRVQPSSTALGPYPTPTGGQAAVFQDAPPPSVPLSTAPAALERAVAGTAGQTQAGARRVGKDAPTRTRAPERVPDSSPNPTTTAPGGAASSGGGSGGSGGAVSVAMNDGRDATFAAQLIRQKPAEALLPDGNRVTLALDRPG